jgi:hypothetical protein
MVNFGKKLMADQNLEWKGYVSWFFLYISVMNLAN